jgi:hypothetical protein
MYLLSDFFVASPDELKDFDSTKSPVLCFPTALARGADYHALFWLFRLIADGWWRDSTPVPDEQLGPAEEAGNPSLLRVPDRVVEKLAAANDDQLAEWAAAWAAARDWLEAGYPPGKLPLLLKDLSKLGREAKAVGRRMYVWICQL